MLAMQDPAIIAIILVRAGWPGKLDDQLDDLVGVPMTGKIRAGSLARSAARHRFEEADEASICFLGPNHLDGSIPMDVALL